ncbi:hypothetical protein YC2023_054071 [Brassica napus]
MMWTTEIYVVRVSFAFDSSLGIGLGLKSSCGLVLAKTPMTNERSFFLSSGTKKLTGVFRQWHKWEA